MPNKPLIKHRPFKPQNHYIDQFALSLSLVMQLTFPDKPEPPDNPTDRMIVRKRYRTDFFDTGVEEFITNNRKSCNRRFPAPELPAESAVQIAGNSSGPQRGHGTPDFSISDHSPGFPTNFLESNPMIDEGVQGLRSEVISNPITKAFNPMP